MDEPQFDSSSSTAEVPLLLTTDSSDAESLSNCSEQISQESAAAAVSSSQNCPHKNMSTNDDEIEPEHIRDVLSSSSRDDNNANETLPADLIAKVKELDLNDTQNTTINLTNSSDVLSRTTEDPLALATDSPDVVSLPSCSEQTYVSEMTVLLVRPSQESATAEPGHIQESFARCSCDDCNNANSSFPTITITKEQKPNLSDTKNTPGIKERRSSVDSTEEANEDIPREHRLDSATST